MMDVQTQTILFVAWLVNSDLPALDINKNEIEVINSALCKTAQFLHRRTSL